VRRRIGTARRDQQYAQYRDNQGPSQKPCDVILFVPDWILHYNATLGSDFLFLTIPSKILKEQK
jgi:hypothetical protein